MSNTEELPAKAVPAQLAFLAIFNPSLGTTDETLDDQIVYYTSKESRQKGGRKEDLSNEDRNERLRQIGLAQGMVDFGKNFSEGRSVDTIETEKSRIILYELEVGWWILAVGGAFEDCHSISDLLDSQSISHVCPRPYLVPKMWLRSLWLNTRREK